MRWREFFMCQEKAFLRLFFLWLFSLWFFFSLCSWFLRFEESMVSIKYHRFLWYFILTFQYHESRTNFLTSFTFSKKPGILSLVFPENWIFLLSHSFSKVKIRGFPPEVLLLTTLLDDRLKSCGKTWSKIIRQPFGFVKCLSYINV